MKRIVSALFTIFFVAVGASPSIAQQEQGSESSMLPEIDPQDIEIRSQFQARFPGLRRQPILGFDPNPRVYQIDPDRTPFMETQEQVVANLPVSELSRPAPPPHMGFAYAEPKNIFARLGFGSFVSPEAKFWGISRLNESSYVGGDIDYSSSDGHLDDENSSFRFFDANAEYATKLSENSRLDITGGAKSSFNNLFDIPTVNIPSTARKEYSGIQLGAGYEHFKNTVTGWKADANIRYYNITLTNADAYDGKTEERVYNISVAKRWAGSHPNETFTVKGGTKGGNFEHDAGDAAWMTAQLGGSYERLFNYSTKVTADANIYYGQNEFEDAIYLAPELTVEHPLLNFLTLKGKVGAAPSVKTLEQLHTQNRFLTTGNSLRHSYRKYGNVEAIVEYANSGEFSFGFRYEDIANYPIFMRTQSNNGGNISYEYYETDYVDASKVSAYASVSQEIIQDKLSINGRLYLQSPEINGGFRIPYEEKIGINSGVTVRPVDGVTFEAWADYMGPRKTYATGETVDGFMMLGGRADVEITKRIGVYIKLVNLLNQDYEVWPGYTERPFQAYGGVTVKL